MRYRSLGSSGLLVSVVGLGWVPTAEQRAELDRIVPPPEEGY